MGTPALFTCFRPAPIEKEMIWGLNVAYKSQQSSPLLPHQSCLAGALNKEGPWFTSAQFSWDCSALRMLPCDCLTVSVFFIFAFDWYVLRWSLARQLHA